MNMSASPFPACGLPGRRLRGGIFECPDGGCANGYHSSSGFQGAVDIGRGICGNRIGFAVKPVVFYSFLPHRLKSSQPDMQRDFRGFNPAILDSSQNFGSEVQACCGWGGPGPSLFHERKWFDSARDPPGDPRGQCREAGEHGRCVRPPQRSRVPGRTGCGAPQSCRGRLLPPAVRDCSGKRGPRKNSCSPTEIFRPGRTRHSH